MNWGFCKGNTHTHAGVCERSAINLVPVLLDGCTCASQFRYKKKAALHQLNYGLGVTLLFFLVFSSLNVIFHLKSSYTKTNTFFSLFTPPLNSL